MAVLLPPDKPNLFYVGSNFGLLLSQNGGADWYYVCEALVSPSGANVLHYLLGSDGKLSAVSADQFATSMNGGVDWALGTGSIDNQALLDAFVDPNDPSFVLVIGTTTGNQTAIYPSTDGGSTFGAPLLTDPGELLSVEIAQSTPGLIYATAWEPSSTGGQALLYKSTDRGQHWTHVAVDVPAFANLALLIAAVDPIDGSTIYYRVTEPPGYAVQKDMLAISTDGAQTVAQSSLALDQAMGAFARSNDGTLYVGGAGTAGGLYVLAPGAESWTSIAAPPITCLGMRGDTLYACSQGINGTFALGSSTDQGMSFTPVFDFSNIIGPVPCTSVESGCEESWKILTGMYAAYIGSDPPSGGPYVTCPADPTHPSTRQGCACSGGGDELAGLLALVPLLGRRRMRSLNRQERRTPATTGAGPGPRR
jgi:photosystem II stability/assembly factor-like uncharacterized protein